MKQVRAWLACLLLGVVLVGCTPPAEPRPTTAPAAAATPEPRWTEAQPTALPPTATPTWEVMIHPPCELVAEREVTAYQRPGSDAEVFAPVPPGLRVYVEARTADGWIGFDPGTAQAGNVGVFRLRWVPPGEGYSLVGVCDDLPVVEGPPPGICFVMCLDETPVYLKADTLSTLVVLLQSGDYAQALSIGDEWVQVDLSSGSAGLDERGWIQRQLASFNGPCDELPLATP